MLKEISKMEQRYDAVLLVIRDGFSVAEASRKVGVSRQTLYAWLAGYEREGLAGLEDRSHRPRTMPHQLDGAREAAIVEMRLAHPRYGPHRIAYYLTQRGITPPSLMTIHRVLARHGLTNPQTRKKVLPAYTRWERGRSMELWQMDVVGGVLTEAGVEAKILTGIDDHSRFVVCAGVMARATLRPVCAHLMAAMERHGVPEEILTDNGKVFTNRFGHPDSETLFDRICRENGISHRLTAPRSPTTTGKIERFHRTLRGAPHGSGLRVSRGRPARDRRVRARLQHRAAPPLDRHGAAGHALQGPRTAAHAAAAPRVGDPRRSPRGRLGLTHGQRERRRHGLGSAVLRRKVPLGTGSRRQGRRPDPRGLGRQRTGEGRPAPHHRRGPQEAGRIQGKELNQGTRVTDHLM